MYISLWIVRQEISQFCSNVLSVEECGQCIYKSMKFYKSKDKRKLENSTSVVEISEEFGGIWWKLSVYLPVIYLSNYGLLRNETSQGGHELPIIAWGYSKLSMLSEPL